MACRRDFRSNVWTLFDDTKSVQERSWYNIVLNCVLCYIKPTMLFF